MKLSELTITAASEGLSKKTFTSVNLVSDCLAVIAERDKAFHAFLTVTETEAIMAARESDERRQRGEARGTLDGIPLAIKDNLATKDVRTTAASKILEHYIAPYDATPVARLREAGAIFVGKTNLDEFAHGASTENSAFGATLNPYDPTRVAGGSSGGSTAAVAAHMALGALGSDTGGSIRQPASFCGVVGLKPTYGRVSRYGLFAMTSSTDVVGPIAQTVEDAALLLSAIAGEDARDATTKPVDVKDYHTYLDGGIDGLRVGVPKEYFIDGTESAVRRVIDESIQHLGRLGASIVEVSLPHTRYAVPVYYIITPTEIASNLARYDGIRYGHSAGDDHNLRELYTHSRAEGFGQEARRRIMIGTYVSSAGYYDQYYNQAARVRTLIRRDFDEVFKKVDVLVTPTSPHTAFRVGEKIGDPLQMYLEDIFVTAPSLAGLPAISIPCGQINGLPMGLQLIGKQFDETTLLRTAHTFERSRAPWMKS